MSLDRPESLIAIKYDVYGGMLYRLCCLMLGGRNDAEDAVQDTFIRYMKAQPDFETEGHEKAWFIRVATNVCHDRQRFRIRQRAVPLDEAEQQAMTPEDSSVLMEIMALPAKCKAPLYLHYYEGYSIEEIARILNSSKSAVKSRMFRGRQILKLNLQEGMYVHENG